MQFRLEQWRETAKADVGLLLLEPEFSNAESVIRHALSDGVWVSKFRTEIGSWPEYRAALARKLRRDDWHYVAMGAYAAGAPARHFGVRLITETTIELSESDRAVLQRTLEPLSVARNAIGRHLAPWPVESHDLYPPIEGL